MNLSTRAAALGIGTLAALWMAAASPAAVPPPVDPAAWTQSDLDAFMRQVLARRDENWKKLQQYVLDEREKLDVHGPTGIPMLGQRREYRWYIRDGYFVRSPVTFDGVHVPEAERRAYEENFLRRVKEREKREADRAARTADDGTDGAAVAPPVSPSMESLITQTRQPQFIDSAYFLKFKFEQGTYAFVGREKIDDREVLRIEYYPAHLFGANQDDPDRKRDPARSDEERRQAAEIDRLMNKNSLVTLWVEPNLKQIVKYEFDNIQTDFLPIAWLFRLDDFKASMTMSQPFKDVWLPREVELYFQAMFALGTIGLRYHLEYFDYQEATASGRIRRSGGGL